MSEATVVVVADVVVEDGGAVVDGAGGRVGAGGSVELTTVVVVGAVLVEAGGSLELVVDASDVSEVLVDTASAPGVSEFPSSSPMNGPIRTAPRITTVATLPHSGHRRQAAKPLRIQLTFGPPHMRFFGWVVGHIGRYRTSLWLNPVHDGNIDTMILDQPWPEDLDPAQAGFKTRTITILKRHGRWDNPTKLDSLTVGEFLAYETAGIAVLTDLVEKGNAAIARHENMSADQRRGYSVVIRWDAEDRQRLCRLADRTWAHQVWRRDPRFADLLPKVDATVTEIAASGPIDDQKTLLRNLPLLQDRLRYFRSRRDESLRVFVSGITGQTGKRLEVLLAMAGFTEPRITQKEGARRLGVSRSRTQQLVLQLRRAWDKAVGQGPGGRPSWFAIIPNTPVPSPLNRANLASAEDSSRVTDERGGPARSSHHICT